MASYVFAVPDNSSVQRDDGAFVVWSATGAEGPLDKAGTVFKRWLADGSPVPAPYVAPPPTAVQLRAADFLSDVDRQAIVTQVADATPAQIKTYVNNNFPSLTVAERLIIAKIILLVSMTIRS